MQRRTGNLKRACSDDRDSRSSDDESCAGKESDEQTRACLDDSGSMSCPRKDTGNRKRACSDHGNRELIDNISSKCKGIHVVSLRNLVEADKEIQRERRRREILEGKDFFLEEITDRRSSLLIPVMVKDQDENLQTAELHVLGGPLSSYVLAAQELVADERFKDLEEGWHVKVYADLTNVEAMRIGQLAVSTNRIMKEPSFQDQAEICRRILMEGKDIDNDDPPKMLKNVREKCAFALGKTSELNELRSLEPTFQLASYSARCWKKAQCLFNDYRERNVKHKELSQRYFMKLQGLKEEDRFDLLTQATVDLDIKRMLTSATRLKNRKKLQDYFVKIVGLPSWEEAQIMYPDDTSEASLTPYLGMDFSKGNVPEKFINFVWNAKQRMSQPDSAALLICKVTQDTKVIMKSAARVHVYLCQDHGTAVRAGGNRTICVINQQVHEIKDPQSTAGVTYMIVAGDYHCEKTVLFMNEEQLTSFIIEEFTREDDLIIDAAEDDGLVAKIAEQLNRRVEECSDNTDDADDSVDDMEED